MSWVTTDSKGCPTLYPDDRRRRRLCRTEPVRSYHVRNVQPLKKVKFTQRTVPFFTNTSNVGSNRLLFDDLAVNIIIRKVF